MRTTYLKHFFNLLFFFSASIVFGQDDSQQIENDTTKNANARSILAQDIVGNTNVDGRLAIGIVSGGFTGHSSNTLTLLDDYVRILFSDDSDAPFPTNDWGIIVNDLSSGGEEYFEIRDVTSNRNVFRIEAGAKEHSLFIEDGGNIGLGTDDPFTNLHVKTTGVESILRLEETNGTDQAFDLGANSTNFFIRDVTTNRLPFKLKPGAEGGSLSIGLDGRVGIGFNSSFEAGFPNNVNNKFEIRDGGSEIMRVETTGKLVTASSMEIESGGLIFPNGSVQTIAFGGDNGAYVNLDVTGTAYFGSNVYVKGNIFPGASYGPSDERLKTDIGNLKNASTILESLQTKSFNFKKEFVEELGLPSVKQYGLIAQEVEKLLPELVTEFKTASGDEYKSVNYTELIAILIQGYKEQQLEIKQMQSQVDEVNYLKTQVAKYKTLEDRLDALESRIGISEKLPLTGED